MSFYEEMMQLDGMFVGMTFDAVMTQLTEMGLADSIADVEEGYYIMVGSEYLYFCEMYFDEDGVCESCSFGECED